MENNTLIKWLQVLIWGSVATMSSYVWAKSGFSVDQCWPAFPFQLMFLNALVDCVPEQWRLLCQVSGLFTLLALLFAAFVWIGDGNPKASDFYLPNLAQGTPWSLKDIIDVMVRNWLVTLAVLYLPAMFLIGFVLSRKGVKHDRSVG